MAATISFAILILISATFVSGDTVFTSKHLTSDFYFDPSFQRYMESRQRPSVIAAESNKLKNEATALLRGMSVAPDVGRLYHNPPTDEAQKDGSGPQPPSPHANLAPQNANPTARRRFLISEKLVELLTFEAERRDRIHHNDVENLLRDPQQDPIQARSFSGSEFELPTTTGECTFCEDGDFISNAVAAEDECELPLQQLQYGVLEAKDDIETDYVWSLFCASKCFQAMSRIPTRYYCCLGSTAPAFLNILAACQPSGQNPSRYCGAEMSNMLAVTCNYNTSAECNQHSQYCQWFSDPENSNCLFRATKANLDYVCTDCNRRYFEQFPAGGLYNYTIHAYLGGVFGAFCNQIGDTYCYLTSANMGYRMAQTATANDFDSMCAPENLEQRLCHRVTAIRASEAARRRGLEGWKYCNVSAAADADCDYEAAGAFLIGRTMEKSAMLACSHDASNRGGAICPKLARQQLGADQCIQNVYESGECPSNCDMKVRFAANNMGCCGPVFGQGGFEIAYQAPYPTRLIIGATPVGLSYINNQSFVSEPGVTRPARTNTEFLAMEDNIARLSNTNSMAGFANCTTMYLNFAQWTQNTSACVQTPAGRTYYLKLHMNYNNLNNCVNRDFVYSAITSDIAAVTGIARTQIQQKFVASEESVNVVMMGSTRTNPGVLIIYTIDSDSDEINQMMDRNIETAKSKGRFIFPTAGVEAMVNCPGVMPNSHTPLFVDMYPVRISGDSPVINSAPTTTYGGMWMTISVIFFIIIGGGF
eukprot:GILJ01011047.1.p1 GENE.GILJ01011047.1~~GILJ01011047.1.p1  ORF type:complete len:762 (-),score=102.04 GILJ01011047.1:126-2411(-)